MKKPLPSELKNCTEEQFTNYLFRQGNLCVSYSVVINHINELYADEIHLIEVIETLSFLNHILAQERKVHDRMDAYFIKRFR